MEETFTELRDKPSKETVKAVSERTAQSVKAQNCSICSPRITEGMREFLEVFARQIEEKVSKVTSTIHKNTL